MSDDWYWKADAPGELAEFVTPDAYMGSPLVFGLNDYQHDPVRLARAVYDRILELDLCYDLPPVSLEEGVQRIIPPAELFNRRSGGSCLDLALAFAGALRNLQLSPLLAVFPSPALRGSHSLVLISRKPGLKGRMLWHSVGLQVRKDRAEHGIFYLTASDLQHDDLIAIETTGLSSNRLLDFDTALQQGRANLEGSTSVRLIDVAYLHSGPRRPRPSARIAPLPGSTEFGDDVRVRYAKWLDTQPDSWNYHGLKHALSQTGRHSSVQQVDRSPLLRALTYAALAKDILGPPEVPENLARLQSLYHAAVGCYPLATTADLILIESAEAGIRQMEQGKGATALAAYVLALASDRGVTNGLELLRPLLQLLGLEHTSMADVLNLIPKRGSWLVVRCSPGPRRDTVWPVTVSGAVYNWRGHLSSVDHIETQALISGESELLDWLYEHAVGRAGVDAIDLVLPGGLLPLELEHRPLPGLGVSLAKARKARLRWDLFDNERLPFGGLLKERTRTGDWQSPVHALPDSASDLDAWLYDHQKYPVYSFDKAAYQADDLEQALRNGAGYLIGQLAGPPPDLAKNEDVPDDVRREDLPSLLRHTCDKPIIIWNNPAGRLGVPWPKGVCEAPGGTP